MTSDGLTHTERISIDAERLRRSGQGGNNMKKQQFVITWEDDGNGEVTADMLEEMMAVDLKMLGITVKEVEYDETR